MNNKLDTDLGHDNKMSGEHNLHSALQFGEQRDFWWNLDFLKLMATRWQLANATSMVDVGCGLGHWSRLLLRFLQPGARCVCVDKEIQWLEKADPLFKSDYPNLLPNQVVFTQGYAEKLPLEDGRFDVATCQTLLMHLKDPETALQEMIRVIKPRGLVICSEPNNLVNNLVMGSLFDRVPLESLVRNCEFWLRCQRGRKNLGEGDECLGDLLPGMFKEAGLEDIQVYVSDKAFPILPPYEDPEQIAMLDQERDWKQKGEGPWDYEQTRKYFLAGGGSPSSFDSSREELEETFNAQEAMINEGRFASAGGGIHYLVSGRKPAKSN